MFGPNLTSGFFGGYRPAATVLAGVFVIGIIAVSFFQR
jgi:hypothetical protein